MTIQQLFCGVLPPGIIQYFFSIRLVSVQELHSYNSINTTTAWKKLRFKVVSLQHSCYNDEVFYIASLWPRRVFWGEGEVVGEKYLLHLPSEYGVKCLGEVDE